MPTLTVDTPPSLSQVWQHVIGTQPHPSTTVVAIAGVCALAAIGLRKIWPVARGVVTIAHEGGHAVVALLSGRRLTGILLHSDTSGVTFSRGKPYGAGVVFTAAAGYIAPSALGIAGAWLLGDGHITALLWLSMLLLAAMLVMIRNVYGVVSVVGTGCVVFGISWFASAQVQAGFAYAFTWFMLLAAIRPIVELQHKRSRGRARDSDVDQLARLTGVPGLVWVALFTVVALGCLFFGGRLLLAY